MTRFLLAVAALLLLPSSGWAGTADEELRRELDRVGDLRARPLDHRSSRWRCSPDGQAVCSRTGCRAIRPTVAVVLDFSDSRYSRCDAKGCDAYRMTIHRSGIFTIASLTSGTFLKALNDGSDYLEVASLGTDAFVSHGRCHPMP